MSLSSLVTYGFTVEGKALRQEQLIGLPPWAAVERFDIEAVPGDTSTEVPVEAVREMLKSLLADRFNLRVHHETRPLPVYELVLNGRGPKPADDQSPPDPRDARISVSSGPPSSAPMLRGEARFNIGPGVTTLTARAISTKQLVGLLQGRTDRVLLDKSGFTQFFDLNIEFASGRTPAPDSDATPLFTAIRDAGFKLTSAREPLEVLVIDQVQLPSAN